MRQCAKMVLTRPRRYAGTCQQREPPAKRCPQRSQFAQARWRRGLEDRCLGPAPGTLCESWERRGGKEDERTDDEELAARATMVTEPPAGMPWARASLVPCRLRGLKGRPDHPRGEACHTRREPCRDKTLAGPEHGAKHDVARSTAWHAPQEGGRRPVTPCPGFYMSYLRNMDNKTPGREGRPGRAPTGARANPWRSPGAPLAGSGRGGPKRPPRGPKPVSCDGRGTGERRDAIFHGKRQSRSRAMCEACGHCEPDQRQ